MKYKMIMNMKNLVLILLLLPILNSTVCAQQGQHRERIKALKVAYITNELKLTPEQAEKFWPVYNRFEEEQRALKRAHFAAYKNENPAATPKEALEYIDANLEYQEEELELNKKYKDRFLEVISAQQLVELYKAEKGFKQMLLKELSQRRAEKMRNRR